MICDQGPDYLPVPMFAGAGSDRTIQCVTGKSWRAAHGRAPAGSSKIVLSLGYTPRDCFSLTGELLTQRCQLTRLFGQHVKLFGRVRCPNLD